MKTLREKLKNFKQERQENGAIFEQLTEENQRYLLKFTVAMVDQAVEFSKDESEVDIKADLLDAQRRGLSAEEFFGCSAEQLAQALAKNLPNQNPLKLALQAAGLDLLIYGLMTGLIWGMWHSSAAGWGKFGLLLLIIIMTSLVNVLVQVGLNRLLIEKSARTRKIASSLARLILIAVIALLAAILMLR